MESQTEREYRHAEGRCLAAMIALRRFDSKEAISELKEAIRVIEAEQSRAKREDRHRLDRIYPAPVPPLSPDDF